MSDASFRRCGGMCAVALAVTSVAYAVLLFLDTGAPGIADRLQQLGTGRQLNGLASLLLALGGILTTLAVLAIHERVSAAGPLWARWAAALGVIGGAMTVAHGYWDYLRVPILLSQWQLGDPARRAAIATFAGLPNPVDPRGVGTLLFVGLFVVVVGRLILLGGTMPAPAGWLGLAYGALLLLAFVAGLGGPDLLRTGLTGLAVGVAGPAWWLVMGRELLRGGATTTAG